MSTPLPHTKPLRKKVGLGCALLIALPLAAYLFLWALGGFLIVGDAVERGDAIVLLSGGGDERLDEAVKVFQSGLADHLLITETGTIPEGGGPRASDLLQRQAEAAGIPGDSVWTTLGKSTNTRDEASAVREFCKQNDLKSIIVVTDPYHTRRTQLVFRSAFAGSDIHVMVRPVRDHWYQSSTWFFSLRGWRVTITEYLKLTGTLFSVFGG